jgi:hypothetical protein
VVDPDLLNQDPDLGVLLNQTPDPDPGGFFITQKWNKFTVEYHFFLQKWNVFLSLAFSKDFQASEGSSSSPEKTSSSENMNFFGPFSDPTTAAVYYILPRSMATQGIIREENGFRIREGGHQDSILNDVSPLLLLLKHKRPLIAMDKGQKIS